MFPKPSDKVDKLVTMPRCQRDWINQRKNTINFAGLVQEIIAQIIEIEDPEYFQKHSEILQNLPIRKIEHTQRLLNTIKVQ